VGTAEYLSPQQFTGDYSGSCDVWACGLIVLEMLTGKRYFSDIPHNLSIEEKCKMIQ
jgi:serine/threonine protein kinase